MPHYKAILSGQSWNSLSSLKVSKKPVFLTYTFNGPQWGSTKLGGADQAVARKALKMWGDASGIRFIEVKGREAELKFQWNWEWGDHSARAEFPELDQDDFDGGLVRDYSGGNIYLNARYRSELSNHQPFKLYILLHEIGHALGLKHPFHRMDHNRQLLKSDLDHVKHTVMSYTGGDINMQSVALGSLDIQAIRALYGSPSQDGKQVAKWSWSKAKQTLTQIGKSKADLIHGVAVKDVIKGGHGDDQIYGFDGNDILFGENGNDFLSGGGDEDALYGDAGNDILRGGWGDGTLQGGTGNDALSGGYGDDMMFGDLDDDVLRGGDDKDTLQGGAGDDDLDGEDDDDTLQGDSGNDVLSGGKGKDLLQGGTGGDTLAGGDGNDILEGGDDNDKLDGGLDDDTLSGGHGTDLLQGNAGNDNLDGGYGDDILSGGFGIDTLQGREGNDTLEGGYDNDYLRGGEGSDTLTGGDDRDQFVFDTHFNGIDDIDEITDFRGSGTDKIALSSTIFGTLEKGPLLGGVFVRGPTAEDANDRILFNAVERSLSYDPDGTGPAAATCFVKFTERVTIYADDIFVL